MYLILLRANIYSGSLPYVRCCVGAFTWIISLNPHNNPICAHYTDKKTRIEKQSNMLKITQLANGRTRISNQICLMPKALVFKSTTLWGGFTRNSPAGGHFRKAKHWGRMVPLAYLPDLQYRLAFAYLPEANGNCTTAKWISNYCISRVSALQWLLHPGILDPCLLEGGLKTAVFNYEM